MGEAARKEHLFGLPAPIMGAGFATRFIMDAYTRMFYPFTIQLAAGFGLSLTEMGWLLFMRSFVGVVGPLFGMIADRFGRRRMMILALLARGLSAIWLVFTQRWWTALPMIIMGLSLTAFIPAQQAYFGEITPRQKLGRVMGIIEFSWSSVALFALPLVGFAIDSYSWRAPLIGVFVLQMIGAILVWQVLPPDLEDRQGDSLTLSEVGVVFSKPNVLATFFIACMIYSAVSAFITLWGIWLALGFNLDAAMIGLATTGIGVAELVGAVLASMFIDKIDKRFSSSLGQFVLFFGFLLMPLVPQKFTFVFILLMALSLIFEISICSLIPLFTEQETNARGTAMALVFSGIAVGTSVGPPLATMMWQQSGLWGLSIICAVFMLIGSFLTWKYLSTSAV